MSTEDTPHELGYRMPAEWEQHEATWLAWPHNPEDWPGKFQAIPWLYAEIVRLLAAHERVHLLVQNEKDKAALPACSSGRGESGSGQLSCVADGSRVDAGLGADFCSRCQGQVAITNWRFNAWAKYPRLAS